MNDTFNENALLGLPVLSPERAAFLGHVARHEADLIAAGFYPVEPKTISTPYGFGTIGPYRNTGVRAMLEGSKPLLWCTYDKYFDEMEINAMMPLVESGIVGVTEYEKNMPCLPDGAWKRVAFAVFYQPDQEEAARELVAITCTERKYEYTMAEHSRIGQLLGYSRADIAAFHIHCTQLEKKSFFKRVLGL